MALLHITLAGQTSAYELPAETGTEISIGRAEECDVPLPESLAASPNHCSIVKTDEGYAIRDNESATGVTLEGRKVEYEMMVANVPYVAGDVLIKLVEGEAETAADAPVAQQPVKKKKPTGTATKKPAAAAGAKKKGPAAPADLAKLAEQYKRKQGLTGADIVYIIVVLLAALYAGMALYSWQHDGNPLPIIFR